MKTHGLKGEVTLNLFSDAPRIVVQDVLVLEQNCGLVPYFVEKVSVNGEKVLIKLEGVNNIELSTPLKGCSIFMEKSKRPKLKHGEFYDDEFVGFEVWDKTHGNLGKVTQVINHGRNRLLEAGKDSLLIPVDGPFIKSISKSKKRIEVELPEGFLVI